MYFDLGPRRSYREVHEKLVEKYGREVAPSISAIGQCGMFDGWIKEVGAFDAEVPEKASRRAVSYNSGRPATVAKSRRPVFVSLLRIGPAFDEPPCKPGTGPFPAGGVVPPVRAATTGPALTRPSSR